nr:MAG TPA: hypothetical protein [Caudoviricetes sp.]
MTCHPPYRIYNTCYLDVCQGIFYCFVNAVISLGNVLYYLVKSCLRSLSRYCS